MPHAASFCATAAKVSLAFSYQKEWSMATALLNCGWTARSQETEKFTLPSFPGSPAGCSCWATAGATNVAQIAISTMEINLIRFILASLVKVDRPGPSSSTVTLHDIEDGILAEPKPMTNFPIRLTFADEFEHFGGETVCLDALTGSPTEYDATFPRRRYPRSHTLAQEISLKFGERGHQRGNY